MVQGLGFRGLAGKVLQYLQGLLCVLARSLSLLTVVRYVYLLSSIALQQF